MFEGRTKGGIPGGQLMITNDVENYPGFPEKIAGPALMTAFRAQAVHQGAELRTEDVNKVDLSARPFKVWAGDDDELYTADALIIATGAQAKWLDIPSEQELKGKGVSACAVCDGAFFRKQDVMVVGGGDTAMEEAMYLSGLCKSVALVHRRESFRASKTMQERVFANEKIKVYYNAYVDEILDVSQGTVTGARIRHVRTNEAIELPITGLFVAIGHTPNTSLFRRSARSPRQRLHPDDAGDDPDERRRRLRRRRRAGLRLPPGRHRRRHRLHGGARSRALARAHRLALSAKASRHLAASALGRAREKQSQFHCLTNEGWV